MVSVSFSAEQEALVKDSWEVMKPKASELSMKLYSVIFEIAPEAKSMFSFLKDSEELPQNNPRLKPHAIKVFKMLCDCAAQLREKGEVVVAENTIKNLAVVHVKKGVQPAHFEVVKEALLRTVEYGVGAEKWSEEMKVAWTVAYDHLATAIKHEMYM